MNQRELSGKNYASILVYNNSEPYGNIVINRSIFRINSYILCLIISCVKMSLPYGYSPLTGWPCFKCMDDLEGFRVRKKQNVAKAQGVRSSINLLTLTCCLEAFAEAVSYVHMCCHGTQWYQMPCIPPADVLYLYQSSRLLRHGS